MIRKKMILADEDEQYLKEVRYEIMEKSPQLDLITFTKKEKLYQYLEQGGAADILVVDEGLVEEKLKSLSRSMTRIVLSYTMAPMEGFEIVKKYQRMESLLNAILLKYAQDSGSLEAVRGNSDTRMVSFYSPAGGTGKTTLALAMATAGARSGLRTLYLNLEEIDSVNDILRETPGSLTDVFLALKAKGIQAGIKMKESIGMDPGAGFYYISGVESISEYEEIAGDDIKKLLESIRELSSFDLVILDQNSGFTEKTIRILEAADVTFVPVTEEEGSMSKLQRFLKESALHEEYNLLFGKMNLIINKAGSGMVSSEQILKSVENRLPCCAEIAVSPVLASKKELLKAGDMLFAMMNPLLQTILKGKEEKNR